MTTSYKTVSGYGEHEIIIERSRFIAYVNRAVTEDEAISFIESIKKKNWDATHNCSAYLIGEHDEHQKANDDGEPSGTAGKPMLEVLKKMKLKNTVVVVTRYFGGIKLGAGGLIRAYGNATKEGVLATGIVERNLHQQVMITFDYTWHGKILNELSNRNYIIEDTQFSENVTMILLPRSEHAAHTIDFITDFTNGQAEIGLGEEVFIETPYQPYHDESDS